MSRLIPDFAEALEKMKPTDFDPVSYALGGILTF